MSCPDGLDRIDLTGLRAHAFHGVLENERQEGQLFIADASVGLDLTAAGESDDLARTVDYNELAEGLTAELAGGPFQLIETVAHRMVNLCLTHPGVRWASVTVHKPEAPITVAFDDVAVTIERSRV